MGPTPVNVGNRGHGNVALGWIRHDEVLTKTAAACWNRDRFTDVTIFCEDRVLHAHRLVLASMSPLLANLLAEADGPNPALMLPEVKAEDMRLLLQFIYQGEVVLPPRRTAALLDLAAQLCVAGVRGGGTGPTPPSPPRSNSPEMDSTDRTEHPSDDDELSSEHDNKKTCADDDVRDLEPNDNLVVDENSECTEIDCDDTCDRPINLASKSEGKTAAEKNTECSRPKQCYSSPPAGYEDYANHSMRNQAITTRISADNREAFNYLNHPALRGCQALSLELTLNPGSRGSRAHHDERNKSLSDDDARETTFSSDTDASAETSTDYRDREIDLSVKQHDANQSSTYGSPLEKLLAPEQQSSPKTSDGAEMIRGRDKLGRMHQDTESNGIVDMRLPLQEKMLLLPPMGNGNSLAADARRTYLEAVLQESLVQQSYTIVLPSHLSAVQSPLQANGDSLGPSLSGSALVNSSFDNKPWLLAGKNSAAAAVAELQCLQGLFSSRGSLRVGSVPSEAGYERCAREDGVDDDDDDESNLPTNLTTSKTSANNAVSGNASAKRNGKEGYSCQVCRKMFTSSSNLAVHSMIHSGTKPFKCDLCSWSFRQKAHLQKHMRHIHKIIVAK